MDIDASARGLMIPDSFLGVSHEWLAVEELVNRREYLQVLKDLSNYGAGPQILRIGGGSTDLQRFVPNATVWKALTTLHKEAGKQYSSSKQASAMHMCVRPCKLQQIFH